MMMMAMMNYCCFGRAIAAGSKKPLLAVVPTEKYPHAVLMSILGAFHELYLVRYGGKFAYFFVKLLLD